MRAVRYRAAGGVVVDGGQVLVLLRPSRDEIRLPKGHVEQGEPPRESALREIREESGYTDLAVAADLGHQTVEFTYQGDRIIRDERYYLVCLRSKRQLERKAKEQQFAPAWMGWEQALEVLTFEAEREWVRRARAAAGTGCVESSPEDQES
jgi:diadenosine hexaphosphate hydrolase (ATP-forming)